MWHFLSWNTVHLQLNVFPFFRLILLIVVSNSFGMCPKIIWVSWITWASVLKFGECSSRFNCRNNQKSHDMRSGPHEGCFITSILWQWNHSCTRAAVCSQALSWRIHRRRSCTVYASNYIRIYHLLQGLLVHSLHGTTGDCKQDPSRCFQLSLHGAWITMHFPSSAKTPSS